MNKAIFLIVVSLVAGCQTAAPPEPPTVVEQVIEAAILREAQQPEATP